MTDKSQREKDMDVVHVSALKLANESKGRADNEGFLARMYIDLDERLLRCKQELKLEKRASNFASHAEREGICEHCKGRGKVAVRSSTDEDDGLEDCGHCDGTGLAPSSASGLAEELDKLLNELQGATSGYEMAGTGESIQIDAECNEIKAKIHALLRSRPAQGDSRDAERLDGLLKLLQVGNWQLRWYDHAHELPTGGFGLYDGGSCKGYGSTEREAIDAAMSQQEKHDG